MWAHHLQSRALRGFKPSKVVASGSVLWSKGTKSVQCWYASLPLESFQMATIVKTPAGTWKAVVRKTGWPTNTKTFRTKRDAEDWARRTEDEMVRGVYIQRSGSERLFRSLKSEWVPSTGYLTAQEAQRDISHYLMHRYNWIRPHQFNDGLPPAVAKEKLNPLSGMG
ncbi:hypothetical protein IPC369_20560 [Pseudomonas aeruginosa]|nr:hypothetical protein IPC369_20560 [Pseudomonas aeruginosa]TED70905.1 hypothetical protein IPC1514_23235 [Pseudomonas aeruginosa]